MKKTVQKFIREAISQTLKSDASTRAQLLQIFAVFYFVDVGEKRFFEFGN